MSYLRRSGSGRNDINWNGGTIDILSNCNMKTLYSDTVATDDKDLIRQKAKLCDDGSYYGVYFILGGWKDVIHGNSIVLKVFNNAFSVIFIGLGKMYSGLWFKDIDQVELGYSSDRQ